MECLTLIITIVALILTIVLVTIKRKQTYWSSVNDRIPFIKPIFLLGNVSTGLFQKRKHLALQLQEFYRKFKGYGPFGGLYFFYKPTILAIDLHFIKSILIKDFNHFTNRGVYYNERDDPLSAHLFSIDGEKWKILRKKLTPTFTSGKMKFMYPTICNVAEHLEKQLLSMLKTSNTAIEMKDILGRFTTDVIGTCAFGIDCNSLNDPNAEFRQMGRKVFESPRHTGIKRALILTFHDFARFFHIKLIHDDVSKFFLKIVRETIDYRTSKHIERNDFMDLLIKLNQNKNESHHQADTVNKHEGGKTDIIDENYHLSFNEIAAQAFVFFLAGFETSSTTMSFCLYELALNQDVQTKARDEIKQTLKKHNGQFTYEAMMDMHYIDQIINETLRKYPPAANLIRISTQNYHVEELNYTIPKDTAVFIPVYALHHDPEYYPEPEEFRPERFEQHEMEKRNPMTFLPFGDGPRNCIGLRFGLMQARIGLVTLLSKFEFSPSEHLKVPLEISNISAVLSSSDGIYLNVNVIK